ncbi:hypothetical protein GCM10022207_13870 [Streptomyces lannensis]|uniref:Uncharacterized protein n=1 Tax=Streptomyces lannensis TaxID=766498 RepID=A0ABP7JRC2_9ACTN
MIDGGPDPAAAGPGSPVARTRDRRTVTGVPQAGKSRRFLRDGAPTPEPCRDADTRFS